MPVTVNVNPKVLRWATTRSGLDQILLAKHLGIDDISKLNYWEQTGEIPLSHLEKIAKKAFIPVGYLFLNDPPNEDLPISDFRRRGRENDGADVSPNLLETIRICQYRQDWYVSKLRDTFASKLEFVNSVKMNEDPLTVANNIRRRLGIDELTFGNLDSWECALRVFVEKIENLGMLVMRSGIVGNNTRRKLDPDEFCGFSLSSEYAPLIFINSVDSKSAQMFSIAHELTHIYLGQSGVSGSVLDQTTSVEVYCNKVAAEILVPSNTFTHEWNQSNEPVNEIRRLSKRYKVSSLVVLIRANQCGYIDDEMFYKLYDVEKNLWKYKHHESSGGDYYLTTNVRLSKKFIGMVVLETVEGRMTYTEAFQLLGIKKSTTFSKFTNYILS